jgi:uncharacterized protein (DUF488 family)
VLLTFGHGTATQDRLTELLRGAEVGLVVDIRRFPGSRRHPHTATSELQRWLPDAGIDYRWDARLGGRRLVVPGAVDLDPWWEVEAFRAYAVHTRTEEFATALHEVLTTAAAAGRSTALMCSESLWWRCHRRLVADVAVLIHGVYVQHLGHDGRLTDHVPAAGARPTESGLVYDRLP